MPKSASEQHAAQAKRLHVSKQRDNLDRVAMGELVVGYGGAWRCKKCGAVHPKSRKSVGCGCVGKA